MIKTSGDKHPETYNYIVSDKELPGREFFFIRVGVCMRMRKRVYLNIRKGFYLLVKKKNSTVLIKNF